MASAPPTDLAPSSAKRSALCFFYARSGCSKGAACSYSHASLDSDLADTFDLIRNKGKCNRGQKCTFFHDAAVSTATREAVNSQNATEERSLTARINSSNHGLFVADGQIEMLLRHLAITPTPLRHAEDISEFYEEYNEDIHYESDEDYYFEDYAWGDDNQVYEGGDEYDGIYDGEYYEEYLDSGDDSFDYF
ncbi:hypothetical protein HDU82_007794 [Entophlyctis luteolus]|nr:hypothetical protein HDU82_007794 [Entophlyctis luteolus]